MDVRWNRNAIERRDSASEEVVDRGHGRARHDEPTTARHHDGRFEILSIELWFPPGCQREPPIASAPPRREAEQRRDEQRFRERATAHTQSGQGVGRQKNSMGVVALKYMRG